MQLKELRTLQKFQCNPSTYLGLLLILLTQTVVYMIGRMQPIQPQTLLPGEFGAKRALKDGFIASAFHLVQALDFLKHKLGVILANFYKDLLRGQEAEANFKEKYGALLEALDGREGDFAIQGTKLKLELKSDFWSHDKWPNFICEVYRSGKKPGGSFQALEHGCRYFCYWFPKDDRLYMFDTYRFCRRVTMLAKRHHIPLETISNGTYNTSYYRIPRELFKDLMLPFFETVERKYSQAMALKLKREQKAVKNANKQALPPK
jgi:hypothetical protein